jgi:elongation factor G
MAFGVLAGYPVEDIKVTLLDGAYHDVDSSELAFKIAGSMVFKEAARKADPALLEPLMAVEVTTPTTTWAPSSATSTPVVARCRAWRRRTATRSCVRSSRCRRCSATSATCGRRPQGQASYSMEFHSYGEVPKSVADEIIEKGRGGE